MSLEIRVAFTSDWHIGTGAGGDEGADRAVVRDRHGFPYVPAKSLTGVLRDAAETIATALGDGWPGWVELLFGSQPTEESGAVTRAPQPAAVSIRAAHVSPTLAATFTTAEQRARLTHVKASVSIDPTTGTARDRQLSFTEMARPVSLYGSVTIDLDEPSRSTALALLVASCRYVESIGGKRRKGAGRCVVEISDNGQPVVVDFARDLPEVAPALPASSHTRSTNVSWNDDGSKIVSIDLVLTAQSPVLVAARTLGNVVEGVGYLPGSVLLPHLDRWLRAAGADAGSLIASDRARVLRAVPMVEGSRSLPASFALQRPKEGDSSRWQNSAIERDDSNLITKQVRSGWLAGASPITYASSTPTVVLTHNIIDDEIQTPTSETGGLFTYVAIAAGTLFHTRVQVPASLRDEVVRVLRNEPAIKVGRSKKDDYGHVTVDVAETEMAYAQSATPGSSVRIWAANDILPWDGTSPEAWLSEIAQVAGLDAARMQIDASRSRVRHVRVDAWQSAWGFPRPTLVAIAAGSCLVVETSPDDAAALRAVSGSLIGARRSEGLGEIAVDHPALASGEIRVVVGAVDIAPDPRHERELDEAEERFAATVSREVMMHRIALAAVECLSAGHAKESMTTRLLSRRVPKSQIGRLRSWVQNLEEPLAGSGLDQLEHDLRTWTAGRSEVQKLLTSADSIWNELGIAPDERTDHRGRDLSRQTWGTAVRAYVESVQRAKTRGDS